MTQFAVRPVVGAVMIVGLLAVPAMAGAVPSQLPEHAAEKVAVAHATAAESASAHAADKARGHDPDKTTGLARAAEVSNSWRFTGETKPGKGNGKGLGVGRAAAVHEALAKGESPSALPSHGQAVSAAAREMRQAFDGMKAKREGHPGRGKGLDK